MLQKNLRCFHANVLCCFDLLLIWKNKSFGRHWVVPLRPGERKESWIVAKSFVPRKLSDICSSAKEGTYVSQKIPELLF